MFHTLIVYAKDCNLGWAAFSWPLHEDDVEFQLASLQRAVDRGTVRSWLLV